MKHIIILGDGMADLPVERLGGKTLLQYAHKPMMDQLAKEGRCGRLITVPEGFPPGSEVANTAILGYDLNKVYEGRGPLEAASIGYEMADDDFAIRCNIITLETLPSPSTVVRAANVSSSSAAYSTATCWSSRGATNISSVLHPTTIPTKSGAPCWCNQTVPSAILSLTPTVSLPSKRPTY